MFELCSNFFIGLTSFLYFCLVKIHQTMASIKFKLRSKENKIVPIKIQFILSRESKFEVNTGFSINPKDWSETSNFDSLLKMN